MNKLHGKIAKICCEGDLSVVTADLGEGLYLEIMVIDTPRKGSYLETGREVTLLFKETEVILTTATPAGISIQNRIPCTVTRIEKGGLLSRIHLQTGAEAITALLSAPMTEAMELQTGSAVHALVKFNEIMLAAR